MARRHTLALLFGLTFAFSVAQDSFSPARTYAVGDKDIYGLSMKLATGQYDVSIVGKLSYVVKKIYDGGDADLESKAYDMKITVLGDTVNQPGSDARIVRYNKFGVGIEKGVPKDKRQPIFMAFLTYRPSAPMKVGETVKVEETLEDDAKTTIKGTAKLESLTDGVAKVTASLDIVLAQGKKPTHIDSIGYFDTKTSKLNRAESKLTNVDPADLPGLPPVNSITVVLEREK